MGFAARTSAEGWRMWTQAVRYPHGLSYVLCLLNT
jgi:hypothetical protein